MIDRQEATRRDTERPLPRLQRPDRLQADPNPKTIDELLPEDHPARLVWELVEDLDMTGLYEKIKSVEGHAGRPAIDPKVLVALWAYATVEGIASARRLAARERVERVERAQEERKKVEAGREAHKKGDGKHARASTTDPDARRTKAGE